jgi:hypothetical protein
MAGAVAMKLTIELEREAEVPELNILLYGDSKQDAAQRAQFTRQPVLRPLLLPGGRNRTISRAGSTLWRTYSYVPHPDSSGCLAIPDPWRRVRSRSVD